MVVDGCGGVRAYDIFGYRFWIGGPVWEKTELGEFGLMEQLSLAGIKLNSR